MMNKNKSWSSIMWKKLKEMGLKRVLYVIRPSAASFIVFIIFVLLVSFFPSQQWDRMDDDPKNKKKETSSSSSTTSSETSTDTPPPSPPPSTSEVTYQENIPMQEYSSTESVVVTPVPTVENNDGQYPDYYDKRDSPTPYAPTTVQNTPVEPRIQGESATNSNVPSSPISTVEDPSRANDSYVDNNTGIIEDNTNSNQRNIPWFPIIR